MAKIITQETTWEFEGSYCRKFRVNYADMAGRDARISLEELEEDTNGYVVTKMIELDHSDIEGLNAIIQIILNAEKIK
jgi:hypothetical protein